ncbi:predicted endonuclease [Alteracholeplasma palmae J233]|uniref:Predicted endonuclease n=1 Tax=Alteracholeplasma palmae (strain ATCC 49389 / J233) TaxID=1318466 RepID=U4KJJ1_ALTPJ|nr:endonuclease [Alteracholeplasma palmae]CCV63604.1 predicted endonuclease [Alteracholeplasma palmae J233]
MSDVIKVIPKTDNKNVWTIKSDGYYSNCVKNVMEEEDYPDESINSIIQNAIETLSQCPDPNINDESSKTGIVIGKVQSGKTSNFISLIGLAFDNGYQIAVVLGGNKNNLLEQNVTRIKNSFRVDAMKLVILDTNKNDDVINANTISEFIKQNRKIIIIGLKHQKHIDKMSDIFNNYKLSIAPTIIIDDEGDQATLNTKKYSKDKKKMSTIYESVLKLKTRIKKHCFISVTATPQANILIDTLDLLSPDFGVLVDPGIGYCGLSEFHGDNQDKYVKVIPEDEISLFDSCGIPISVYEALASFFVSNGVRKYRGDFGNHALLFHPSQRKVDHASVVEKLQSVVDSWKNKADCYEDIAYQSLKRHLVSAYDKYKNDGVNLPSFVDLEEFILDSIKFCSKIHLTNSDTDASKNSELYKTNIFVGGNMVERGLTIKGLAITYIIRRAKTTSNVDNTEQRARWFGYKEAYIDICRVYTTQQIKDDFHHIFEHDEALWDTIKKAEQQGTPFKEIGRVFKNNSRLLRLTRSNVARTQKLDFDQFKSQNSVILDEKVAIENNRLLEKIKNDNKEKLINIRYSRTQNHLLLPNLKFSIIKKDLFNLYKYPTTGNLNKGFFDLLEAGFQHLKKDPITDILWVRYETKEERNIDESGRMLSTLMQGHNPNVNSPDFYIGDRKLPDERADNIQVQVHLVKPNKIVGYDFYLPFFVIYLPSKLTEALSSFVTKGEK